MKFRSGTSSIPPRFLFATSVSLPRFDVEKGILPDPLNFFFPLHSIEFEKLDRIFILRYRSNKNYLQVLLAYSYSSLNEAKIEIENY